MKKWFVVEFSALSLEGDKIKRIGVLASTYAEAIEKASAKCGVGCPWSCVGCSELKAYMFVPLP